LIALATPNAFAAPIPRIFAADSWALAADSWGATVMPDYRAYILGGGGHRFLRAIEFSRDHADDATALLAAKQLINGHDVELWEGGRLVARLDHRDGNPRGEFPSFPELINEAIPQPIETIAQPIEINSK
jgi:hypothetical protein